MPIDTKRTQRVQQLELFRPQPEAIQWGKLPRDIQQRTIPLLARLLREYSKIAQRPEVKREGSHE